MTSAARAEALVISRGQRFIEDPAGVIQSIVARAASTHSQSPAAHWTSVAVHLVEIADNPAVFVGQSLKDLVARHGVGE